MGLHEIEQSIIAHSRHIPSSSSCELVFSQADLFPLSVVEWQVDGSQSSRLILDRTLQSSDRLPFFARRLACVILLLEMSHSTGKLRNGSILINLNDNATGEGIAFCSNNQSNLLIPDPEFISRRGYQDERDHWSDTSIPWMERLPVVFWRGSTSGRRPEGDWRRLPRLQLCRKAKSNPDLFDAGIAE
jgi:hypothetical protein